MARLTSFPTVLLRRQEPSPRKKASRSDTFIQVWVPAQAHYYRPERGDVILNPFDARSAYWSPFAEIAQPADADRIAHQLVTSTGREEDDVWLETSRILVANILRVLGREGKATLPDLLDALQAKTRDEMKLWLAGTSSARTFEDDADRATGSVLFMLAKASNLLQFL